MKKPDVAILQKCVKDLDVLPGECLYVGDDGSFESETALSVGMNPIQVAWYLKDGVNQPVKRKAGCVHAERTKDILEVCFKWIVKHYYK